MQPDFNQPFFCAERPIQHACIPHVAGLYVIAVGRWRGTYGELEVVYVGQSSDLATRVDLDTHHAAQSWLCQTHTRQNLFVAYALMPGSSREEREYWEGVLIDRFHPVCNEPPPPPRSYVTRAWHALAERGRGGRKAAAPGFFGLLGTTPPGPAPTHRPSVHQRTTRQRFGNPWARQQRP